MQCIVFVCCIEDADVVVNGLRSRSRAASATAGPRDFRRSGAREAEQVIGTQRLSRRARF